MSSRSGEASRELLYSVYFTLLYAADRTEAEGLAVDHNFSSQFTVLSVSSFMATGILFKKVKVAHTRLPSVGFRS